MLINNMNYLEEVVEASNIVGGKHTGGGGSKLPSHGWHFHHCEDHWTVNGADTTTLPADGQFEEHWYKCPDHARIHSTGS
jgi:hypothetical protein